MLLISIFLEYGFHDVSKKYRQSCAFFLLSNDFFFFFFCACGTAASSHLSFDIEKKSLWCLGDLKIYKGTI